MANSNFNPFDTFNNNNISNGNPFMPLNAFAENNFTPPNGNFSHDTSSNANMSFGLPPNLDLSAFFGNPGGMFSNPLFGQHQPSTLAWGFGVDANANENVKDQVGENYREEDESQTDEEGGNPGESVGGSPSGKKGAGKLSNRQKGIFNVTVCNLLNDQDPVALFHIDDQQNISQIEHLEFKGSSVCRVYFNAKQTRNKAFDIAAQKCSTEACSSRIWIHKAMRAGDEKAARILESASTDILDLLQAARATKVTRAPFKTATEAKADELRAKLLAMKSKTPQPALIMPPKPTSTISTKPITFGDTTLPRDIDRLIEEGLAAAGSMDGKIQVVRPAVKTHLSQLPTPDFTLPKDKKDEEVVKSVVEKNESTLLPISGSSRPATADESMQYSKLRGLSKRLDTPSRQSKADNKLLAQTRSGMQQAGVQRSNPSAAKGRGHPLEQSSDPDIVPPDHDSRVDISIPEQQVSQISTARHSPHQKVEVPPDGLEEGELRSEALGPTVAIRASPPAIPTTESHDYYEDLETWLELTGYHDTEYRGRVIARQRKKQELQAQLDELEREAQTERVYTPTTASITSNMDVKPMKTVMAPPPLPFARSTTVSRITTETASPVELPEGSGTSSIPRKRERADFVMDFRASKSHKVNQRPFSKGRENRPVSKNFDISPSSSRNEPHERRISFSHNRQNIFVRNDNGRDNREGYYGDDSYKPHWVNSRVNRQYRN